MEDLPVLFVGHGSPMNIVEKNEFTDGWKTIARKIPKPKSILSVSAHWYGKGETVSTTANPETIHDFYGFPEELYEVQYPAPGAPDLAMRVADIFDDVARIDTQRGLDHGTWSVFSFMYPEADIPVCQLSVNAANSPQESYTIGQRLRELRSEGVLVMGSGNIVHNLSMVAWDLPGGYSWADEFDAYIQTALLEKRHEDIINYQEAGISAEKAVYYRDHFDPLLYALGATSPNEDIHVFNDARTMGSLSMTSYLFGTIL